jgi:hypothetical protein
MGSGVAGGTEAFAHALRAHLVRPPDDVLVKLDVDNAFNSLPRTEVLDAARGLPVLPDYVRWLYGDASVVVYADRRTGKRYKIANEEGVIQGEPRSSWLYNMTMRRRLERVRANPRFRRSRVFTIHDDIFLAGPVGDDYDGGQGAAPAASAFTLLGEVVPLLDASHQHVSAANSKVLCLSADAGAVEEAQAHADATGMPLVTDGVMAAGVPIGTVEYMRVAVKEEHDRVAAQLDLLERAVLESMHLHNNIPIVQGFMRVIRMCTTPSLFYTYRTVPPTITKSYAAAVDRKLYGIVLTVLGHDVAALDPVNNSDADTVHKRLFLPVGLGGMGFTRAEDIVEAAFVGSWTMTGPHVAGVTRGKGEPPFSLQHAVGLVAALEELQGRTSNETLASVEGLDAESILRHVQPPEGGGAGAGGAGPGAAAPAAGSEDAAPDQPARPPKHAPGSQGAISSEIAEQRQRFVLDALPTAEAKAEFVSCGGRGAARGSRRRRATATAAWTTPRTASARRSGWACRCRRACWAR